MKCCVLRTQGTFIFKLLELFNKINKHLAKAKQIIIKGLFEKSKECWNPTYNDQIHKYYTFASFQRKRLMSNSFKVQKIKSRNLLMNDKKYFHLEHIIEALHDSFE